jgi:hypothetical protein
MKSQHDRPWSERREGKRVKAKVTTAHGRPEGSSAAMSVDELLRLVPKLREAGVGRAMNDLTTKEDE